ncbi:hypothetical protein BDBG_16229, partial [Blastomyces gilchristii SLH14081]
MRNLKNNVMFYCNLEYVKALYQKYSFRCDLMTCMHKKFSHLESSELMSVLKSRTIKKSDPGPRHSHTVSLSMTENIQMYTHKCLNYQIVKESKKELKYEKVQYQMKFMKAVSEMIEKMMMKFLHNEIYINYEMSCEILTDNSANL